AKGDASSPRRIDLDQAFDKLLGIKSMHHRTARRGNATMDTVRWAISTTPKILLMLAASIVIRSPFSASPCPTQSATLFLTVSARSSLPPPLLVEFASVATSREA